MPRRARALWLLLRSSHPEPVAGVTVIVTILALSAGRGPFRTTIMATAVVCGQLLVGWTNDFLDADLDLASGRVDKPVATGRVPRAEVRNAAVAAFILVVPLSFLAGLWAGVAHLIAVFMATAYNFGLKRTPYSVVPYVVAFGLVPAFITLGPPITHTPPLWATAAAGLLGAGAHFTQTLPDIARERIAGVRGLPQLLGQKVSAVVGPVILAAAAVCVALGPAHPKPVLFVGLAVAVVLFIGIVGLAAMNRLELAFRLTLVSGGIVVVTLLAAGVSL
ncbi:MAG TPA: UbiA family prenyltransferase [Clostridia bacterium]|nr:UbiA family prenyltransferase [Clostridia bacterium]